MKKVAIGLPVYNGENYVAYAIESVLAQTFDDWELIISDNASTDKTMQICEAYANRDARIRYFRSPINRGAAWNFNETFRRSSSQYFRWLSHDDYMLPQNLEKCVQVLDSSDEFISCATATGAIDLQGYRVLDATEVTSDLACQGLTLESERLRLHYSKSDDPAQRYLGILLYSRRCNEIYGLIRSEVFRQTQLHPNYCGGEKVLLAEIALRGKIYEIEELLFHVRWHTERFTANASTKEQQEHMAAKERRSFRIPHQYYATCGYLGLLSRVRLSFWQRVKCFAAWLRFVAQISKWGSLVKNTLLLRSTIAELEGQTRQGELIHSSEISIDLAVDGHSDRRSVASSN